MTVNRIKQVEASLERWGQRIAIMLLLLNVGIFLIGITAPMRESQANLSPEDWQHIKEMRRLEESRQEAKARYR